jgi:tryptophan synthase beta chain
VLGPDPYPRMVRDFHVVIGEEARTQLKRQAGTDSPDLAVACVGGGSNSLGLFTAFLPDRRVRLIGVEAGGRGGARGQHAARFAGGALGVLHGTRTLVLQDEEGQIAPTHSVSAGLDYPAVGPEHVLLEQTGRVEYTFATDAEAIAAFHLLARTEGILPALESAHAVAEAVRHAPELSRKRIILVNLSGRGDKDLESVLEYDREHPAAAGLPRRPSVEPPIAAGHGWRGVPPPPTVEVPERPRIPPAPGDPGGLGGPAGPGAAAPPGAAA